jgi:outer membrane protein assembly factor BamB
MFQRDRIHTGQSPYTGIVTMPVLQWARLIPGADGEPSTGITRASDGTLYLSSNDLFALNPNDGSIRWSIDGFSTRSTPAVGADGTIYWGHTDTFLAVTPGGQIGWSWTGLSGNLIFGSAPAIAEDGTIYVTHDALFSFTPGGSLRWVYPFAWVAHSSPAIGPDGTIYVGDAFYLYAISPAGTLRWRHYIAAYDSSPSVAADGTVYSGTYGAKLYAYYPDGTLRWIFETDEARYPTSMITAPPAIGTDGTIYFGSEAPNAVYTHFYAVNPDGSLKWKVRIYARPLPGIRAPAVIDIGQNVFVCALNGSCYGIAPDGTVLWEYVVYPDGYVLTAPYLSADGEMLLFDGLVLRKFGTTAVDHEYFMPLLVKDAHDGL